MSGGVDSSVATKLLLDEGHKVVGVTLDLFCAPHNDENIAEAQEVCRKFGIEHRVYATRDEFATHVITPFITSYLAGATPNPCIACNRYIKFGALVSYAIEQGFDAVATGHYARIEQDAKTHRYLLKKGIDPAKDQSYVLYNLTQKQLKHTVFPLGSMVKETVRTIARQAGFETAAKKESQDICFIPDGDYHGFIERKKPKSVHPGKFLSIDGTEIGRHRGITHYTIGQRRGIGMGFGKPMYVVAKDAKTNTITLGENPDLLAEGLIAGDVNLISVETLVTPMCVQAKIRYNQKGTDAVISGRPDGTVRVDFAQRQRAVAPGQAVVFYQNDIIIGGGTILYSVSNPIDF